MSETTIARHHSVYHYASNDTDPATLIYSVVNERTYDTTDGRIETEEQADAIALYRDMQAGYVPSPDELAATRWELLVEWER